MAQEETPSGAAGATDSSAGSSTSSASPYVGDAGPGFDPKQAPPVAESQDTVEARGAAAALAWEEEQVADWLRNAGDLAHAGFGVGEYDWAMTQRDLERIAPPLTRILNRYEPTARVAEYSDPAAAAMGFGLYGWRSALERIHVLRAQQAAEEAGSPAVAPGFTPPPPEAAAAAVAHSNGGAPAPAQAPAAPGPGQPGHIPVTGPAGTVQESWADRLRGTRPEADE